MCVKAFDSIIIRKQMKHPCYERGTLMSLANLVKCKNAAATALSKFIAILIVLH